MRVSRMKDIREIIHIKDKMQEIVDTQFSNDEVLLIAEMMENGDELFWDIMAEVIDNHEEQKYVQVNDNESSDQSEDSFFCQYMEMFYNGGA